MNLNNINFLKGSRSWWTHVETASEASHFTHNLFTSGDYYGGSVQAANRRALLADEKLCERLGIEELSESYSTDTVLFPIAALYDKEIIELFEGLENYPAIDDELISEVEHELEIECWDSFGRRDFNRHLQGKDLLTEDQADDITNDQLDSIYWQASRETNYNIFQVESGTSGYFNFDSFGGLHEKSIPLLEKLIKEAIK